MALFRAWLTTASCAIATASEAAVRTSPLAEEPLVQIDATGSVRAAHQGHIAVGAADENSFRLMRQEVRRHVQGAPEKIEFQQLDEVDCPVGHGSATDSVSRMLCHILTGSNTQVAGKLERAVKGLSLRPKNANATEFVVADRKEEKQLANLKAALWDLWFCAKHVDPPCDPLASKEHKVELARQQAFTALELIHNHPEAGMSTTLSPDTPADSERIDHMAGGSVMPVPAEPIPNHPSVGWSSPHFHRREIPPPSKNIFFAGQVASLLQTGAIETKDEGEETKRKHVMKTETANVPVEGSQFADDVLTGLLHGDDKKLIQQRLWNAINKMDIQKVLEDDIVKIEDDNDGNYKALQANMLILHECASMPDCPATNCCDPKHPEQQEYKDARNAAYEAYHNIQHDTSLAKQTYLDLLSTVASGKHKDYYPPSHPLYVPTEAPETTTEEAETTTIASNVSSKASEPAPTVEEGNMLLYAICAVTAVVILAIGFLLQKTNSMDHSHGQKAGGGGGGEYGAEQYGGY